MARKPCKAHKARKAPTRIFFKRRVGSKSW